MIWFIAGIILTILIIGGIIADEGEVNPKCLLGLVGLLVIVPSLIGSVPTGNIGIKTSFGKVLDDSLREGIHLKAPWEKIVNMDGRLQKYENEIALESSTKDMQVVTNIMIAVNYQVSLNEASNLYRNVGTEYQTTVLEPAIHETIKSTISQYNASELVTMRSEIAIVMTDLLNEKMREYGILISSITINNFDFSAEYNASIERKAVAEQNALAAEQELQTTKAEAEKKLIEAEATKKANEMLQSSLSDQLIKKEFIEKWNGVLPNAMTDSIYGIMGGN